MNPFYPTPADAIDDDAISGLDQIMRHLTSGDDVMAKAVMLKQLPKLQGTLGKLKKFTPPAGPVNLAEMACPIGVKPDWARPVVVDRKASTAISVANTAGIVAGILAAVFPNDAARQFFLGNGTVGAQVKERMLVGLKAKWTLTATGTVGGTAGIHWTEEQLRPIRDLLYRCTFEVFPDTSNTPAFAATPLGEYDGAGKAFPQGLSRALVFAQDGSYLKVSDPGTVIDAVNVTTAAIVIQAELELTGLFISPPRK